MNDQLQRTAEDFGYVYGSEEDYLRVLRNGDLETVRRYVADGYDVNMRAEGGSPLLLAAAVGDQAAFDHFRAAGADMQATFPHGSNVLHTSVMGKNAELVRYLAGEVDIDAKGVRGLTALNMAAMTGDFYLAYVLLQAGADPEVADAEGSSARQKLEGLLGELMTLEDFMKEFSVLEEAVKYGDHEQVYRLRTEDIPVQTLNDLLFVSDKPAVVQALLDAGADVEAVSDTRTLLAYHVSREITELSACCWIMALTLKQRTASAKWLRITPPGRALKIYSEGSVSVCSCSVVIFRMIFAACHCAGSR
ncbi:ankyrin repeat domain-containing protein [Aliamphritea spongicola]|nr:ankyrin repeat domain-containing protein [Aliamphritea spongicola]